MAHVKQPLRNIINQYNICYLVTSSGVAELGGRVGLYVKRDRF